MNTGDRACKAASTVLYIPCPKVSLTDSILAYFGQVGLVSGFLLSLRKA